MARPSVPRESDEEVAPLPLIPMIDIIFILLLFFMLGSRFREVQKKVELLLPRGAATAVSRDTDPQPVEFKVSIGADERGRGTYKIGSVQYPTLAALQGGLSEIARIQGVEKKMIIVDPSSRVHFEQVMAVLDICVGLQLTDIAFARPQD